MCENCPYHYKTKEDRFPCCHFEGPEGWAPCEWEEEDDEEEEEDYPELIFDPEEEEDE